MPLAPTLVRSESSGYLDTASVLLPTNGKVTYISTLSQGGMRGEEGPYFGGEEAAAGGNGSLAGGVENANVLDEGRVFIVAREPQAESTGLSSGDVWSNSRERLTLHDCRGRCHRCSLAPGLQNRINIMVNTAFRRSFAP